VFLYLFTSSFLLRSRGTVADVDARRKGVEWGDGDNSNKNDDVSIRGTGRKGKKTKKKKNFPVYYISFHPPRLLLDAFLPSMTPVYISSLLIVDMENEGGK
jgi:hypothetical protein